MIRITIESDDPQAREQALGLLHDLFAIPRRLTDIQQTLDKIRHFEKEQVKVMADLQAEFAALSTAFTGLTDAVAALGPEVDREIQQVLDAIAAGADAVVTVEDARTRITALTSAVSDQTTVINDKVAALVADNPPTP